MLLRAFAAGARAAASPQSTVPTATASAPASRAETVVKPVCVVEPPAKRGRTEPVAKRKAEGKATAKSKAKGPDATVRREDASRSVGSLERAAGSDEVLTPEKVAKVSGAPQEVETACAAVAPAKLQQIVIPGKEGEKVPEVLKVAHQLIDLARDGRWEEMYKVLDACPEAVNVRPSVREFGMLHQAAFHGETEVVRHLIVKYGADVEMRTKLGNTAAEVAAKEGHTDVVSLLSGVPTMQGRVENSIGEAAPANASSSSAVVGVTPAPELTSNIVSAAHKLIDLSKEGLWSQVYAMLDKQRELVNVRPEVREFTALHQATYLGDLEAVRRLIDTYGADAAQPTKGGKLPSDIAKEEGHWAIAELLLARSGKDGRQARIISAPALSPKVEEVAHRVIDLAKDGNWKDVYKTLDDAEPGVVNVRPDVREYGILHQAAFHGDMKVVHILLDKYGADPSLCTKFGRSVVEVATEEGHLKLAELLRSRSLSFLEDDTDDGMEMKQMPDGTWKVASKVTVAMAPP